MTATTVGDAVYRAAVLRGATAERPAFIRKAGMFLKEIEDEAQVELVCRWLVKRAGRSFKPHRHLTWDTYGFQRDAIGAELPDDAGVWAWKLWEYEQALLSNDDDDAGRLANETRRSIGYWLGRWDDALVGQDLDERDRARTMLSALARTRGHVVD